MSAGLNQKHVILFQKQNVKCHKLNPTLSLSLLVTHLTVAEHLGELTAAQRVRWWTASPTRCTQESEQAQAAG